MRAGGGALAISSVVPEGPMFETMALSDMEIGVGVLVFGSLFIVAVSTGVEEVGTEESASAFALEENGQKAPTR
jgi:hypothetical protein